jgi:hypothetical protein
MSSALWDGSDGGTGECVQYAERVGRLWVNLWDEWVTPHSVLHY